LADELGVDAAKVTIIANAVDLPAPALDRARWRERLRVTAATPLVCMVANLHRYKDHATLVAAWRRVVDGGAGPSPVLLLAGRRGDTAGKVESLVARLALGESVQLLGEVDDVAGLLAAVDLFAFSSRHEGCPNAVLEAMAAGLPVVATDDPGNREALGPEGYFVASGDSAALADAIVRLLADPERRRAEGTRNRQRIATAFPPQRSWELHAELISGLLATS
ncbi:MAG TPA: glycosyltransferase, partial [Thermoanaerobaculia bacterium]|nr:glycosyltransferase [Thermoanaerobaculia bacterium]